MACTLPRRYSCDAMACGAAGQGKPEQDVQETVQPQGGVSEAEKAEKKKAKKARQRAARAQAAAQLAEVRHLKQTQVNLAYLEPSPSYLGRCLSASI